MNKKYLSVVLFGALLAASAGTFTSCKDYDDDIKGLQEQIDKNGSTVGDLQTQLATLKAAAEAAQAAADAAQAAADAAKTAADAAKVARDFTEIRCWVAIEDGTAEGTKQKPQNPAADDGVANGDADGTNERDHAEDAAKTFVTARHRFLEGTNRTGAHGAAECHFPDDTTKAEPNDENQKRY